jgi:DNA-binding response OmpR family regulator
MTKPHALVIEDDFGLADILSTALTVAGYEVSVVRHGKTARKMLEVETPHLITLDLHLPGVDGKSLLKQIRSDERLAKTYVMLVTADARQAQTMQDEVTLVLVKPVSYSQLNLLAQRLLPAGD